MRPGRLLLRSAPGPAVVTWAGGSGQAGRNGDVDTSVAGLVIGAVVLGRACSVPSRAESLSPSPRRRQGLPTASYGPAPLSRYCRGGGGVPAPVAARLGHWKGASPQSAGGREGEGEIGLFFSRLRCSSRLDRRYEKANPEPGLREFFPNRPNKWPQNACGNLSQGEGGRGRTRKRWGFDDARVLWI